MTRLNSARRPDLIEINKKKRTCKIVDFAVPADLRIKLKAREKNDKYLDFTRELKKIWNMNVVFIPIVIGAFKTVTKRLLMGLEDLEVGDQPNYSIIENGQNTEKSCWGLRRLAVTQISVEDHLLMWKTLRRRRNVLASFKHPFIFLILALLFTKSYNKLIVSGLYSDRFHTLGDFERCFEAILMRVMN